MPGRFESVRAGQSFTVFVDYSHTPDSLENALQAARAIASGRVLVVFGCGGDRDRGKRPLMGAIAAALADVAFVTSDNPRSEDPPAIIDEIVAGVPRRVVSAWSSSLTGARRSPWRWPRRGAGDVVLIAGKGHEQGQIIGDRDPLRRPRAWRAELLAGLGVGRRRDAAAHAVQRSRGACGGRLEGGDPQARCRGVVHRQPHRCSRATCSSALRGERFDGDDVRRPRPCGRGRRRGRARRDGGHAAARRAVASSSTTACRRCRPLAAAVRRAPARAWSAITGSAGKTSHQGHPGGAAASRRAASSPRAGNFNNEIGVPLTLLRIDERSTEVVVASWPCAAPARSASWRASPPDVGVITNIAPVHLELVGSIDDVAAAKAELIEELGGRHRRGAGRASRCSTPYLGRHRGRVVTFGDTSATYTLVGVSAARRRHARARSTPSAVARLFDFNFTGGHYLTDALAALAAFLELGYRLEEARGGAAAVAVLRPARRGRGLPGGGLLLNDAYNANPLPTAAVDHLVRASPPAGRPWPSSATCTSWAPAPPPSTGVGEHVAGAGVRLVAVGELARDYLTGAAGERWFADRRGVPGGAAGGDRRRAAPCSSRPRARLRLERVADARRRRKRAREERTDV